MLLLIVWCILHVLTLQFAYDMVVGLGLADEVAGFSLDALLAMTVLALAQAEVISDADAVARSELVAIEGTTADEASTTELLRIAMLDASEDGLGAADEAADEAADKATDEGSAVETKVVKPAELEIERTGVELSGTIFPAGNPIVGNGVPGTQIICCVMTRMPVLEIMKLLVLKKKGVFPLRVTEARSIVVTANPLTRIWKIHWKPARFIREPALIRTRYESILN